MMGWRGVHLNLTPSLLGLHSDRGQTQMRGTLFDIGVAWGAFESDPKAASIYIACVSSAYRDTACTFYLNHRDKAHSGQPYALP